MRRGLSLLVPLLALPLLAASPPRTITLDVPAQVSTLPVPAKPPRVRPRTAYEPAPLPNRDIDGPVAPRASNDPTVAPSLFTRNDTYRGEGFARGSSATAEQERRVRPGAGLNLRMPFAPN